MGSEGRKTERVGKVARGGKRKGRKEAEGKAASGGREEGRQADGLTEEKEDGGFQWLWWKSLAVRERQQKASFWSLLALEVLIHLLAKGAGKPRYTSAGIRPRAVHCSRTGKYVSGTIEKSKEVGLEGTVQKQVFLYHLFHTSEVYLVKRFNKFFKIGSIRQCKQG